MTVTGPITEPRFEPVRRTLATSLGRGVWQNLRGAGRAMLRPLLGREEAIAAEEAACRGVGSGG